MGPKTTNLLVLLAAIVLAPSTTIAALLLEVDVRDSANVIFTATTGDSSTDASFTSNISGGFTIADFFTSSAALLPANTPITGDLTASQGSGTYELIGTFNFSANTGAFEAGDDISIYSSSSETQTFVSGERAFSGVAIMDFSSLSTLLPSLGASGDLYTGFIEEGIVEDFGELIGTWEVVADVPTPASLALVILGLAGLGWKRRTG